MESIESNIPVNVETHTTCTVGIAFGGARTLVGVDGLLILSERIHDLLLLQQPACIVVQPFGCVFDVPVSLL